MKPTELFQRLENTGNIYSYFKRGRKYVYFSTGGWSENEELINELEKDLCFNILLRQWRSGGHYIFDIPNKKFMNYNFTRKCRGEEERK